MHIKDVHRDKHNMINIQSSRWLRPFCAFIFLLTLFGFIQNRSGASANTQDQNTISNSEAVSWLEPRGLNAADLIGILPEAVLKDSVINWTQGEGIMRYVSGSRSGDNVTMLVSYEYADSRNLACLGKPGIQDELSSAVAQSTMRVFDGTIDITSRVALSFEYIPAGQTQPVRPPNDRHRYNTISGTFRRTAAGDIIVPANIGCSFTINGAAPNNPHAEFKFESPQYVTATEIYSTKLAAKSYIGPGNTELLTGLQNQMRDRYSDRHLRWNPDPSGDNDIRNLIMDADYIFYKAPPAPIDAYANGANVPGFGTYRVTFSNAQWAFNSVDHTASMLLPFHTQWKNARSNDGPFLETFTSFDRGATPQAPVFDSITSPEYILPPGVSYRSCMSAGNCSNSILEQVYNATYDVEIFFYKVDRINSGLEQIPLRLVGNGYSRVAESATQTVEAPQIVQASTIPEGLGGTNIVYLPMIVSSEILPEDDPRGCPCGWFDPNGRMFDFVPAD